MNYYYDILINLNEEKVFEFYEWIDTDPIEHIKKIPIIRVKSKVIKDFLTYNVELHEPLLSDIYLKTEVTNNKLVKNIPYMLLVTDTKSALVIECNVSGRIICLSKLLLIDELNLAEIAYAFEEEKISYERLDKKKIKKELRLEENVRNFLLCEIKTLYEKNETSKLKYLYYEWTNELNDDLDFIIKELKKLINGKFTDSHYEIYELVKLSYQSSK